MQTTGLFSSSSPQQANVGGGSSLIGTLGAALVLVFGVVLLTGLSLDRTQTAMVRFLAEKGVALVTALESGVRSGTRSRTGIRLQYLVEELAEGARRGDDRGIASLGNPFVGDHRYGRLTGVRGLQDIPSQDKG